MIRVCQFLVITSLLWSVFSTLSNYPHQLAYFNESVGGPENGHKHLLGSNLDWGQDLLFVGEWACTKRDSRFITVVNSSLNSPKDLGLEVSGISFLEINEVSSVSIPDESWIVIPRSLFSQLADKFDLSVCSFTGRIDTTVFDVFLVVTSNSACISDVANTRPATGWNL